jgi:hypothetical protein
MILAAGLMALLFVGACILKHQQASHSFDLKKIHLLNDLKNEEVVKLQAEVSELKKKVEGLVLKVGFKL